MKRFLIFLVAVITTVCIGVTFYQFAKNDEVIKINTETIYINYGDKLSLNDLGFLRKEPSKETKIDFNAGGDEVMSIIKYDELSQSYIPTSKGGSTTIKITTTNRKYKAFTIDVKVGIGTEESPYYISNEAQLFDVCNQHIDDGACFELVRDIKLTDSHNPIGLIENGYREFNGKFNGNYHTISNLKINECDYAGLFAIIGSNSQVYNLNLNNSVIEGSFINAGTVAGICYGNINKVVVSNSTITNNKSSSNTGAVVGLLKTDNINNVTAGILRTYAYTDDNKLISANGNLGGLAGTVDSAVIHACHTKLCLKNASESAYTGGLVGEFVVNPNAYIRESYSISQIQSNSTSGNIAGLVDLDSTTTIDKISKELVLVGLYYDKQLNSFSGIGNDLANLASFTNFAITGKTSVEMKIKDTYIYYVNSSNNIIYWDKVWYLADGSYPTLTFISKFDDVILEDCSQLPTTPDDPTTPDISNPDTPNADAIIITNKQELIYAFQTNGASGNYILGANIDLGGMNWIPNSFTGSFKSNQNKNYTISNFNIVGNYLYYAGFFSSLSSAHISNINFSDVKVTSSSSNDATGIVVGYVAGNVVIDNINVVNAEISNSSKYTGGIVGYTTNIVKIEKCDITNLIVNNSLNAGGVVGLSSSNTYIAGCKLKNSNTINALKRIGGIVAVNYGIINDCSFNGFIKSTSSSNAGYFGGLCGVNYSVIANSSSFAEINVNNISTDTYYFVGGLCGYNLGEIMYSCAYGNSYSANNSTNIVYLGGLTGYNSGNIEYCVVDVLNIGSVNKNIYTAGLSVFNYGGNIFGCFAYGNLNGYHVAGLTRSNSNNGTIDSCMAGLNVTDRATYKGVNVVSLAYTISNGTISNCIVNATLNCTDKDGWVAGFAGFMPCTNNKYGTISNCIANVSFSGVGVKYLDIAQFGLMNKTRLTGTITNCVISDEANVEGVIISEYSKFLWTTYKPASGSNYIIANEQTIKNIDTYLNPSTCDFDISVGLGDSKWLYVNNSMLPIPRAYLEVFGYEIIGL